MRYGTYISVRYARIRARRSDVRDVFGEIMYYIITWFLRFRRSALGDPGDPGDLGAGLHGSYAGCHWHRTEAYIRAAPAEMSSNLEVTTSGLECKLGRPVPPGR